MFSQRFFKDFSRYIWIETVEISKIQKQIYESTSLNMCSFLYLMCWVRMRLEPGVIKLPENNKHLKKDEKIYFYISKLNNTTFYLIKHINYTLRSNPQKKVLIKEILGKNVREFGTKKSKLRTIFPVTLFIWI